MANQNGRMVMTGIGLGVIAGVVFAAMEIGGAAMMGDPPLMPVRMFASILLGQAAMEQASVGMVVTVGTIVHLVLSAAFGIVYGWIDGRLSPEWQTSYGRQAALGVVFGVALWFVNFHIIGRVLFPWFLGAPQVLQAMMHALFFGLPLGLLFANSERHAHPAPRPAAQRA